MAGEPAPGTLAAADSPALLQRWFDELARVRPGSEHLDLDRAGLGRADSDVTHVIDVSTHRDARDRAITAHESQVSPYHGMPASLRDDFLNTDRLDQVATGPSTANRWWDHTQAAWIYAKRIRWSPSGAQPWPGAGLCVGDLRRKQVQNHHH